MEMEVKRVGVVEVEVVGHLDPVDRLGLVGLVDPDREGLED